MATDTALHQFSYLQAGRESTKGTLVAATRRMVGRGYLMEKQERYYPPHPRGVAATVGGDGVLTRKWTELEWETELTPQELLWPMLLGLKGNITATGAMADKTWLASRTLTAEPTLDSATIECIRSDGTTNHIYKEAGYVMCSGFSIDFSAEGAHQLKWRAFGRARQSSTPTGSLANYTNRDIAILVGPLTAWYNDSSWANLGMTQLTGIVKAATLEVDTGLRPNWTMDNRSDQDWSAHAWGNLAATLSMTVEVDDVGAARYAAWRAGTRQYIRVSALGPTLGASNYAVKIDGSYRIIDTPQISEGDGGQLLAELQMEAVYDTTGTKIIDVTSVNDLAAVGNL